MQNLKRNINIGFRVSPEEHDIIIKRAAEAKYSSIRAYLLKMALAGLIINMDMSDVQECSRLLRNIGNNVNQIAKRVNSGGNVYAADLDDIKETIGKVWENQNVIIKQLSRILEVSR